MTVQRPVEAVTRAQELFGRKPDPLKPAVEVGKNRFTPRFLQAIDRALRFRPADRSQTVTAWKALFPQPRLQTPSRRRWLAAGGVLEALAVAGLASVYAIPWWQDLNRERSPQPALPEKTVTAPAGHPVDDPPTPGSAEPKYPATARVQIPEKQPPTPPNETADESQQPPAKLRENEAELAAVREPEAAERAPSADTKAADANQLVMAETKTDAQPIAEEIKQISPPANMRTDIVPSDGKPFESPSKAPALAPLQVQPATETVALSACQAQIFSVSGDDGQAPYRWWVDGKRQSQTGARFTFSGKTPGAHEVRVAAATEQGSPHHRWQVVVSVPSVTQTEVEQWLAGVQHALEQRDVAKLEELGYVHSEPEAADLLEKLQARQKLQVVLQNVRAELAGDHVVLSFERVDRWYDPKSYSIVVDYSSHEATLVRQGCASLIAAR